MPWSWSGRSKDRKNEACMKVGVFVGSLLASTDFVVIQM